jgi:ankyrin repeat protein
MLIAQGANLSLNDHDGRSPLALAITRNNERIVITLIEAGAPLDDSAAVCRAAAIGVNAASALIKRNINLNELRDADGNNPCHYAAKGTDVQVLKALVAHGVDIDALDKNDKHCVHKAASSGRLETLRWLIDSAVDVNVEDCTGQTALMHACMGGHVPCALLLISAGADVCAVDSEAHTVLHFAEHCCLSRPLRHALVAAGADMDVRDDYDRSPRDIAGRMSAIEHSNRGLNGLPPFVALMMMMATFKPAELISESELNLARRETENMRRQFVRERALQVCMGLQSLRINALQMCEILVHACGPVAQLLSFGWWWKVATTVKHFHKK